MIKLQDKKGREIHYAIEADSASAYHEGKKIGFIETSGVRDIDDRVPPMPAEIRSWEVDLDYRRAGIATRMVKLLVEELGMLDPGDKNIGIGGRNALTSEGEYTVRYCQKLGLINTFADEVNDCDEDV